MYNPVSHNVTHRKRTWLTAQATWIPRGSTHTLILISKIEDNFCCGLRYNPQTLYNTYAYETTCFIKKLRL